MEAIEVYLACPRGHKQPRIDAMYDLREATKATLTILCWRKVKDVAWAKRGMKPVVESVWSEVHSPGHARVGHGDNVNDPDAWLKDVRKWAEQNGKAPIGEGHEKYLFQHLRKVRAENANPDNLLYIEDSDRWKY